MKASRLVTLIAFAITAAAGCDDGGQEPAEDVVVLDTMSDVDPDAADTRPDAVDDTAAGDTGPSCGAQEQLCGALCVDTRNDPRHCGGCDQPCEGELACVDGACQQCTGDLLACGADCVDVLFDTDHCGDCERTCTSGELCVAGRCRATTRAVAVGARHACRLAGGQLECWGDNGSAQLGPAASGPLSTTPVAVAPTQGDGASWLRIVAAPAATCGLLDDGRVQCWGSNVHGELGVDAPLEQRAAPATVHIDAPVADLVASADANTLCAVVPGDGGDQLHCWGENAGEVLVEGGSAVYDAPRRVELDGELVHIDAVAIGARHLCVGGRDAVGEPAIVCRGQDDWRQTTVPASLSSRLAGGLSQLVAGRDHTCAVVDATREVVCWGRSARCQLGSSEQSGHCATAMPGLGVATEDGTLDEVDALAASGDATCARVGTSLWCWGHGASGNLGRLGDVSVPSAARVADTLEIATVDLGADSTCLLEVDGALHCTGRNTHGQLGDGTVSRSGPAAVALPMGSTPIAVTVTATTSCALAGGPQGNQVWCWGDGARGQLGVDPAALDGLDPAAPTRVDVGTSSPPFLLAGGRDHLCALTTGEVSCWGANAEGQSDPTTTSPWVAPTPIVTGLAQSPAQLVAGAAHSCAMSATGPWACWGEFVRGALGDVTTAGPYDMSGSGLAPSPDVAAAGDAVTCTATSGAVDGIVDAVECIGQRAAGFGVALDAGVATGRQDALRIGVEHACALVRTGDVGAEVDEVRCWGPAEGLRLGDEVVDGTLHRTALMDGAQPVSATRLAVGARHTCAAAGPRLVCWGDNASRQLGLQLDIDSASLTPGGSRDVLSVAAGDTHTCVVVGGSGQPAEVLCWGTSTHGQLGPNAGSDRARFELADFAP